MQPPLFSTIVWLFTHDSLHFVDDVIVAFQKAERELQYLTLCNNVFYTIVMGWAFDYFLHLTNARAAIDVFFAIRDVQCSVRESIFCLRNGSDSPLRCLDGFEGA